VLEHPLRAERYRLCDWWHDPSGHRATSGATLERTSSSVFRSEETFRGASRWPSTRADIVARFLRRGVRAAATGGVVGLGVALIATRLLGAWLVGVRPLDPVAFVGAAVVMSTVVALACYIPARRAARIDPVVALRDS
jgi:hypothetical protein